MKFNLYISTGEAIFNIFGLNGEALEKVIDAYLFGKQSVTVAGKKYSLKELTTLKIFEHNVERSPEEVSDYYLRNINYRKKSKKGGHHYLPLSTLQKMGRDVTHEFLGNLEFGTKSINISDVIPSNLGEENRSQSKKTLHALSINEEDGYLIREGLSNRGLLGFLSSSEIEETFGLEEFLITFPRGQDYFYTLNTSSEKFDNRNPIKKGILGYARKTQHSNYHQLYRFFSDKHQTHLYIINSTG